MTGKNETNIKSAVTKMQKKEKQKLEEETKQNQIDDKYWKDDDKHVNKKAQRKVI